MSTGGFWWRSVCTSWCGSSREGGERATRPDAGAPRPSRRSSHAQRPNVGRGRARLRSGAAATAAPCRRRPGEQAGQSGRLPASRCCSTRLHHERGQLGAAGHRGRRALPGRAASSDRAPTCPAVRRLRGSRVDRGAGTRRVLPGRGAGGHGRERGLPVRGRPANGSARRERRGRPAPRPRGSGDSCRRRLPARPDSSPSARGILRRSGCAARPGRRGRAGSRAPGRVGVAGADLSRAHPPPAPSRGPPGGP